MVPHERSSAFVTVPCSCGRILRAKTELVGTEVRCWDCHQMVTVPSPHPGQRVARELSDGARVVIQGPGQQTVVVAAVVTSLLLTIPYYGVWISAVALTLGTLAYGEIMARVSRGPTDEPEPLLWKSLVPRPTPRLILGGVMTAGIVAPLWLRNAGLNQAPHWDAIGLATSLATSLLLPTLMLMTCARTGEGTPLGVQGSVRLLAGHPIATLLALAVVPLTVILVETGIGLALYLTGSLPFYALDYMPMPLLPPRLEPPVIYNGIPHYSMVDYRSYPAFIFERAYLQGIRHGYTFVAAVPASLSMGTPAKLDPMEGLGLPRSFYFSVRFLITLIFMTCLLAAFAIQARWLGLIPALSRTRRA